MRFWAIIIAAFTGCGSSDIASPTNVENTDTAVESTQEPRILSEATFQDVEPSTTIPMQTWKAAPKFEVVARLVAMDEQNVILERDDGQKAEVPISRLTKRSQRQAQESKEWLSEPKLLGKWFMHPPKIGIHEITLFARGSLVEKIRQSSDVAGWQDRSWYRLTEGSLLKAFDEDTDMKILDDGRLAGIVDESGVRQFHYTSISEASENRRFVGAGG